MTMIQICNIRPFRLGLCERMEHGQLGAFTPGRRKMRYKFGTWIRAKQGGTQGMFQK